GRGRKETGTINTWNMDKQFGFVSCDSGRVDLFTHSEYIKDTQQRYEAKNHGMRRGDRIEFEVREPDGGRKSAEAYNVVLVDFKARSRSRSRSRSRRQSRRRSRSRSRRRDPPPRRDRPQQNEKEKRPGDWECPKCGDYQFARNIECRKCQTPKPRDGGGRRPSPSRRRRSPSQRRRSNSRRRDRSKSRSKRPASKSKRSRSRSRS
ncbi:unnamed protein product, partial [Polarella glacialis]